MDGGVVDEVNAVDGAHLQSKDSEYSLKSSSSSMLELRQTVIPGKVDDGRTPHVFEGDLDGKILDIISVSEHSCAGPPSMDDAVEELTLRNYDSGNLAIVGASTNRDRMQTKQNPWQHLYQIVGGSGGGSSCGNTAYGDTDRAVSSVWEDTGNTVFPELLGDKPPNDNSPSNENKPLSSNTVLSPRGIRTKILSKSGFSEYFVKSTLKGKGVICRGPARVASSVEFGAQTYSNAAGDTTIHSDAPLNLTAEIVVPPSHSIAETSPNFCSNAFHSGVSLREWLKGGQNKGKKVKSLYIFRQIVGIVDFSHSRGMSLQDLRPSCFKLSPSDQVIYLGSMGQKGMVENVMAQGIRQSGSDKNETGPLEWDMSPVVSQWAKKRKFEENTNFARQWLRFPLSSGIKSATSNDVNAKIAAPQVSMSRFDDGNKPRTEYNTLKKSTSSNVSNTSQPLSIFSDPIEEKWYTSPEELSERCCAFSSNIYSLGVLLFELLSSFDSARAHAVAMLDLHHRILPPNFLSENTKEAGFCLWLLHPEPASRPTTREILQSELISGVQELCEDELSSSSINEEDAESELLEDFLVLLKEQKQKDGSKLVEEIRCLEADIKEVEKRQTNKSSVLSCLSKESLTVRGNSFRHQEHSSSEVKSSSSPASDSEMRLTRNISELESAYFSMRSSVHLSDNAAATRADKELLENRENWHQSWKDKEKHRSTDRLGVFFNGLCKYARYNKFELRGLLRNGDFSNSANVICSLSFDRDEDYFAAAGVSKKIKIYEFNALFNDSVGIHCPVIEMSNKSRLSCICWNSYIRNYLASTDYDGVVKLWDAGTGQGFSQFIEHNKRAWSVDFSQVDPTKLASGSDDCSVKLWRINEKNSLCTIRNIANVCCVQFSSNSSNLLAFGSADYKTYCYDVRNVSTPWCILTGHEKAVSYVKFLDSETLVSASTDNTLKLWDLNKTSSSGLSTNACILALRGHTNEKNFVGLSVADGYIACGSETNEVFAYYRSLPMPITSHKFGSIDPISGKETDDDNGQFVSSVCWRRKSGMVVAANSSGCIKLLQMV
ncbi:unnamed protein product [Ilex paraguariensis]|uniref:Protein kinase domain-containing protein n=1 Tax=Ilex paraguariensis TaxID=185542 RepID=A0ABC8RHK9_9AQUA